MRTFQPVQGIRVCIAAPVQLCLKTTHMYCIAGGSDPFYIVSYYVKWVITPWTHGIWCLYCIPYALHYIKRVKTLWTYSERYFKYRYWNAMRKYFFFYNLTSTEFRYHGFFYPPWSKGENERVGNCPARAREKVGEKVMLKNCPRLDSASRVIDMWTMENIFFPPLSYERETFFWYYVWVSHLNGVRGGGQDWKYIPLFIIECGIDLS